MSNTETRQAGRQSKQDRRRERREEQLRQERERAQRARILRIALISGAVALVGVLAFVIYSTVASQTSKGSATQQSAPAPVVDTSGRTVSPIDSIECASMEFGDYHVHAHLSLYIDGQLQTVMPNIGITKNAGCLYWLHTHDASGIIHVEAPKQGTYTLGNFFNVWRSFPSLKYPTQTEQKNGWQVYVDGKAFDGDFRTIPLNDHTLITMAYNSPGVKPDTTYNWSGV